MVALEVQTNQYLGGDSSLVCAADTQKKIDERAVELVRRQHDKAVQLLLENRKKLDELYQYLYQRDNYR